MCRAAQYFLARLDEAHNLAPSSFGDDSDLAEMLQPISLWFEHRVFLTATPHNTIAARCEGLDAA
jgi:hypothetical protein